MDFFKSVFSDDPEPLRSDPNPESEPESELPSAWSFGGLIRTLTEKSESVIETYRRDLQEFGTGLKKELEVAQGSLDEIGTTVIKSTAQIISQGKEAILAVDIDNSKLGNSSSISQNQSFNSKRYSRFEAQVRAVQGDVGTYCEEPEDLSDYSNWKSGFDLKEKSEEIEVLFEENGAMGIVYERVVPSCVDHETFWCRYFYKVHKLRQAEDLRVKLVNRAIEEEELSWDVDDSDEEKDGESDLKLSHDVAEDGSLRVESGVEDEDLVVKKDGEGDLKSSHDVAEGVSLKMESGVGDEDQVVKKGNVEEEDRVMKMIKEDAKSEPDEKEVKSNQGMEPVVSSQPLLPKEEEEEEDLGWDEIEDLSNIDDDSKRPTSGSPNRADLRKRLSAAEEEEDLSWDIEEDD